MESIEQILSKEVPEINEAIGTISKSVESITIQGTEATAIALSLNK